jgi:hypothetical protein
MRPLGYFVQSVMLKVQSLVRYHVQRLNERHSWLLRHWLDWYLLARLLAGAFIVVTIELTARLSFFLTDCFLADRPYSGFSDGLNYWVDRLEHWRHSLEYIVYVGPFAIFVGLITISLAMRALSTIIALVILRLSRRRRLSG